MKPDFNTGMPTHWFNPVSGEPPGLHSNRPLLVRIRWLEIPQVILSVWVLLVVTLVFTVISSATERTAPSTHDTDWPRFRGPNGTGISHADTIPLTWTAKDYNWVLDLPGHGHGSPVVVGDRLYLMSGKPDTAERIVVCVDVNRGDILWKRNFPSKPHRLHHANSYGSTTPAADANGVVVTWSDPEKLLLMALDRKGKTVWQKDLGPYQAINGSGTSPIIVDDLVVLMNVQMDPNFMISIGVLPQDYPDRTAHDSFLVAVDRKSGKIRWQVKRKTYLAGYATPCVRTTNNGDRELIFLDSAYGLAGVDIQTGEVNWETSRLLPSRTVASPVVAGDLIFGSHGRGVSADMICALRAGNKSAQPKVEYEIKTGAPLTPTPLVKDKLAFLWSDAGIVTCIEAATGTVVWRNRVGGSYYGSPIWVNGYLYCVDRRGTVVVVTGNEKYELLGKTPLGEPSFATPAVAGGAIYFRTETKLLSLGGEK